MTTKLRHPHATVVVDDIKVLPTDGSVVTLDESWAPYAQATIVSPLVPGVANLSTDPRDDVRGIINGSVSGHWEFGEDTDYVEDPAVPGSITPVEGP